MKNTFLAVFLITFSICNGNAQWIFGGGMKYNTNNEFKAIGLNAKVGKDISDKFDLNLDVGHYIASTAKWSFDLDLHYKLFNINDKILINPVAGINFTVTEVVNNSLSLGASFRFADDRFTYYLEPKWILDNKQFVLSVGILL